MASNNSLTRSTWACYQTALRHLQRCRRETGWSMVLPLEEEEILHYVLWLRRRRGLQATSVENMLSAMKKVQISTKLLKTFFPLKHPVGFGYYSSAYIAGP